MNCLKSFFLNAYFKVGFISTGWFNIFYWSYKVANIESHYNTYNYRSMTYGGKIVHKTSFGVVGALLGVASTLIWPISTSLTILNIHERIVKGKSFFFTTIKHLEVLIDI